MALHQSTRKVWYAPHKFEAYGEPEIKAVEQCLRDGWLAGLGPRTEEFESRIATFFGKKHGVFVNSGSSACLLALACLELPKGSEIVTPACTFSTTVAPIVQLGLQPVFCDVGLKTYVPSVDNIMKCVTRNTRAIMIPNLIGNKPDWTALKQGLASIGRTDIVLIEDSADTMTTTLDTDIATTSFYASHVITAGGMGGMVMVNDDRLRVKCKQFRDWGRIGEDVEDPDRRFAHEIDGIPYDFKFLYGVLGYNMKGSEMCAAFGLVQLDRLPKILAHRRALIERYKVNLANVPDLVLPDDSSEPNWLAIPLQYPKRLELLHFLESRNIQTRVTFAGNVTRHPAFRQYFAPFDNADVIMRNGFLLGAHHGMSEADVDYVCEQIKQFVVMERKPHFPLQEAQQKFVGSNTTKKQDTKQQTIATLYDGVHDSVA